MVRIFNKKVKKEKIPLQISWSYCIVFYNSFKFEKAPKFSLSQTRALGRGLAEDCQIEIKRITFSSFFGIYFMTFFPLTVSHWRIYKVTLLKVNMYDSSVKLRNKANFLKYFYTIWIPFHRTTNFLRLLVKKNTEKCLCENEIPFFDIACDQELGRVFRMGQLR